MSGGPRERFSNRSFLGERKLESLVRPVYPPNEHRGFLFGLLRNLHYLSTRVAHCRDSINCRPTAAIIDLFIISSFRAATKSKSIVTVSDRLDDLALLRRGNKWLCCRGGHRDCPDDGIIADYICSASRGGGCCTCRTLPGCVRIALYRQWWWSAADIADLSGQLLHRIICYCNWQSCKTEEMDV